MSRLALPVAPRSRRIIAASIDAPLLLLVGLGAILALTAAARRAGTSDPDAVAERMNSRMYGLSIQVLSGSINLLQTVWQTPGRRLAGVRIADARTGARPSVRQALIHVLVPIAKDHLVQQLTRPLRAPEGPARTPQPSLQELRTLHAEDPRARREAMRDYLQKHPPQWSWKRIARRPLASASIQLLVEVWVRRHWPGRSLADVLAGTATILDR